MKKALLALSVLAVSVLACGGAPRKQLVLYPSPTVEATQTAFVQTVVATKVVQITTTPVPSITITPVRQLCVSADEAVYLRPSASIDNYPIVQLGNGTEVVDLGGRDGDWLFVQVDDKRGWINGKYLSACK
jgi:hypothetical protein